MPRENVVSIFIEDGAVEVQLHRNLTAQEVADSMKAFANACGEIPGLDPMELQLALVAAFTGS